MASEQLRRTIYTDPTTNNLVRVGNTTHGESLVDQTKHEQPLERVHGSGPHGWGIASGLAITATLNQPGLKVLPGIALDAPGRHISLAQGGKAEVGPNANNPGTAPNLTDVLATGAAMPTAGLTGSYYVTVTWRETFDADLWNASSQTIFEMLHTPWIKLELAATITNVTDDGSRVVLGRVEINAGNVTGLTHERRREASVPAGSVQFSRGQTTAPAPNFQAENTPTGEIRARAAGGLEVKVAAAGDQIDFNRDGGNIAKVSFGADQVVARRADGKETVVIDSSQGNITVGTSGVEGDVLVRDANNRLVITLDGDDAAVVVGAAGNEGDILVKDNGGQNSVRIDGNTGTVFGKRVAPSTGDVLDVDSRYFRIHGWDLVLDGRSGGNKRALVDLNNRLVMNYASDYANGVDINKLHLTPHVKVDKVTGFDTSKRPTYNQWITLEEFGINLQFSEWFSVSTCTVGMLDNGSVNNFWWGVANYSYVDTGGQIVIKWVVNYRDGGNDWRPWVWTVSWLAFRR